MRNKLVEKYGKQVVIGPTESMAEEEKLACVVYDSLSEILYEVAPKIRNIDKFHQFFIGNDINTIFDFLIPFRMLRLRPVTSGGKSLVTLWFIVHITILVYAIYGVGSILFVILNPSSPWPRGPLTILAAIIMIPFFWLFSIFNSYNNLLTQLAILFSVVIAFYVIPILITEFIFTTFYRIWYVEKTIKSPRLNVSGEELKRLLANLTQ